MPIEKPTLQALREASGMIQVNVQNITKPKGHFGLALEMAINNNVLEGRVVFKAYSRNDTWGAPVPNQSVTGFVHDREHKVHEIAIDVIYPDGNIRKVFKKL